MANLKLGNVFNQFSGVTPESEQRQASSLNLANTFSGIADTLSGKDFQPGMSGFEQALIAGSRGAAQGFKNKAEMEKAKRQDELNAWAQTLADYEQGEAKKLAMQEQENQALDQVSVPAMVALAQYKQTGDKASYEGRIKQLVDSFARQTGREAVQVHVDPNNDAVFSITMKDLDDGETDTQAFDLTSLVGRASKINAEIGTQGMSALGLAVPEKPATGEAAKLKTAQDALGRELTEDEKKSILGLAPKAGKAEGEGRITKGREATEKADAELVKQLPKLQGVMMNADSIINTLAETGIQTGPLADWKTAFLGGVNTIAGQTIFGEVADLQKIRALTAEQVFAVVKNLGAGTGISNADRDFAAQAAGTELTDPRAIARLQAIAKATALRNSYFAQAVTAYDEGSINYSQLNAIRNRIYGSTAGEGQSDKFALKGLASRFEDEYLSKLNDAQARRLGIPNTTAPAAVGSTVVDQFGLDMGQ